MEVCRGGGCAGGREGIGRGGRARAGLLPRLPETTSVLYSLSFSSCDLMTSQVRLKPCCRVNFAKRTTWCLRPFYPLNPSSLNAHIGA